MSHLITAALAVVVLGLAFVLSTPGFASASSSQGDLVLEGHTDANGDTPELRPLEADKIRQGLAKAKEIDPERGAELERAFRDGRVRFGLLGNLNLSALGSHDWNTIAISFYSFDPTVIAVTMLHEWLHVTHCEGGPPSGGTTNDPTGGVAPNPCGPVSHMQSIALAIGRLCGENNEPDSFCSRCKAVWISLAELYAEAERAAAAGCASVPTPSTMYDEFCVDACRDC